MGDIGRGVFRAVGTGIGGVVGVAAEVKTLGVSNGYIATTGGAAGYKAGEKVSNYVFGEWTS